MGMSLSIIATAILQLLVVYTSQRGDTYARHARERGAEQYARELGSFYGEAASFHGVDVWLPIAVGYSESGLDRERVGSMGELDVMQLNPRAPWGKEYSRACRPRVDRMLCTWTSVWIGTGVLVEGIRRCGDVERGVGWYKSGRCVAGEKTARVVALWERLRTGRGKDMTTTKKEEGPRSFAVFIQGLAQGDANQELSNELHQLGIAMQKEADERGEEVTGSLVLTLRAKAEPRGIAHFNWKVKRTDPEKKRIGGAVWFSRGGNFVDADPRQPELFPREVKNKPYDVVDVAGNPINDVKEV
jgi:hypothetical protein